MSEDSAAPDGATLAPPAAALGPVFFGSDIYRGSSYGRGHPLRIPRVSTVMDLARALGWLSPAEYRTSPCAKPAALTLWHDPDYVAALQAAEAQGAVTPEVTARYGLGTLSNPVFPEMYRRPATGAGAVMLAAELLARAPSGAVFVPGGGTHHGLRSRANGFCYLNDPVLGLLTLRRAGLGRIAYVDLDAHHCDGVAEALADDPRVLQISVHEAARWPFSGGLEEAGAGAVFNLPVPRGMNDSGFRLVLDRLIVPRLQAFRPEALILQCGADALAEDPLSRLMLSNRSYLAALTAVRPLAPRLLMLGGGGYNPWSVGRAWTLLWGGMIGAELPERLPEAARAVLRGLSWGGGGRPPPEPHLIDTLLDPPREGPVAPEIGARLERLSRRPDP
jgi:acetoin utilization protein AcuC